MYRLQDFNVVRFQLLPNVQFSRLSINMSISGGRIWQLTTNVNKTTTSSLNRSTTDPACQWQLASTWAIWNSSRKDVESLAIFKAIAQENNPTDPKSPTHSLSELYHWQKWTENWQSEPKVNSLFAQFFRLSWDNSASKCQLQLFCVPICCSQFFSALSNLTKKSVAKQPRSKRPFLVSLSCCQLKTTLIRTPPKRLKRGQGTRWCSKQAKPTTLGRGLRVWRPGKARDVNATQDSKSTTTKGLSTQRRNARKWEFCQNSGTISNVQCHVSFFQSDIFCQMNSIDDHLKSQNGSHFIAWWTQQWTSNFFQTKPNSGSRSYWCHNGRHWWSQRSCATHNSSKFDAIDIWVLAQLQRALRNKWWKRPS